MRKMINFSVSTAFKGAFGALSLLFFSLPLLANVPVIKVDFDITGRPAAEVHEPGYSTWLIQSQESDTATFNGVQIILNVLSPENGKFMTSWYKAGIANTRLGSDGIQVANGNTGAKVEMRIRGLATGTHSLLTYFNTFDSPAVATFAPINIYVDGVLTVRKMVPGNRVVKVSDIPASYLLLNATKGKDVVVVFEADLSSGANQKNVLLCGFEINAANVNDMAVVPYPSDADRHVDADNGTCNLQWQSALSATSHDLYFGTDLNAVENADHSSSCFQGNKAKSETSFLVNGLSNRKIYYWRVDERKAGKDGAVTKGNVWSFRPRHLAFPGAEGYGRFANGGRGGKVVAVTNLSDSGPGSLREAVTNDIGPRTIVFAVSGLITLKSRLLLNGKDITIAGQTAPGKGICLRTSPFGMSGAEDVIIRDIRHRLGAGETADGMGMQGSNHCIIDHCTISWAIDEVFSSRSGKNITLQRTLISEALNQAGHKNYKPGTRHGYAATIGGDVGSFHHNLLAHCYGRDWSMGGGLDGNGAYSGRLDLFNNVVYNWGGRATDGGAHEVNFVNNYYKPGAGTTFMYALNAQYEGAGSGTQQYYVSGNVLPGKMTAEDQRTGCKYTGTPHGYEVWVKKPFFPSYATIQSADEAYKCVTSDIGATQPMQDATDVRVISDVLNGTYSCVGSASGLKGFPDKQEDVGGYEDYPEVHRPASFDSDMDGLPDWWETLHGTSLHSASGDFSDANADVDDDGYTNLEDYLNWMALQRYETGKNQPVTIDLSLLAKGFTGKCTYTVSDVKNGDSRIVSDRKTVRFTPLNDFSGQAFFSFTVKDKTGCQMTRTIGVLVGVPVL
jgi:hypothetical protein